MKNSDSVIPVFHRLNRLQAIDAWVHSMRPQTVSSSHVLLIPMRQPAGQKRSETAFFLPKHPPSNSPTTLFIDRPVSRVASPVVAMAATPSKAGKGHSYDYDVIIIGCGVGGHGAALHAVEQGLKVGIIEGHDIGGTCVNRGCVPSKALLAAAGRLREMKDADHMKAMGIQVRGLGCVVRTLTSHFLVPPLQHRLTHISHLTHNPSL